MNNSDISSLLKMLSKMDKKDLESGLSKANNILSSTDKTKLQEILNNIKKQ